MDPYETLGVKKNATAEELKKAFRKIVRESHPDLNPDDPKGADRFKAASAAYDLLKDPEQRARYDRGEIDASGQERPKQQYYKSYAGAKGNPYRGGGQRFEDFEDLSDFFSDYLRGAAGKRGKAGHNHFRGSFNADGEDVRYRLDVPFLDAALGGSKRLTLPDGSVLDVQIPRGIADGQTIRLRGKGGPAVGSGKPGDALVTVSVAPHEIFTRDGDNIRVVLPITIDEALLGGRVEVPTITGNVSMTIPKGSSSGQVLRLREKGIAPRGQEKRGDQLVELKIVSPKKIDEELVAFMTAWRKQHKYDPRKGMMS